MREDIHMSAYQIASLYIGLHVFLFLILKGATGYARFKSGVSIGHGDDPRLLRMGRVQGNAVEDVPILLVGLWVLASFNAPAFYLHACGGGLLIARILHATGLASSSGASLGRSIGTLATLPLFIAIGGGCIYWAFSG